MLQPNYMQVVRFIYLIIMLYLFFFTFLYLDDRHIIKMLVLIKFSYVTVMSPRLSKFLFYFFRLIVSHFCSTSTTCIH
jgi:hypothetical protein